VDVLASPSDFRLSLCLPRTVPRISRGTACTYAAITVPLSSSTASRRINFIRCWRFWRYKQPYDYRYYHGEFCFTEISERHNASHQISWLSCRTSVRSAYCYNIRLRRLAYLAIIISSPRVGSFAVKSREQNYGSCLP
jgi:hypothetical protein